MYFYSRIVLFLIFSLVFFGCESKIPFNPDKDEVILDMNQRIELLKSDLTSLQGDLTEVEKVLNDPDIDSDLRNSIRKEIHEGRRYEKQIEQWIAYLKVRQNKRYKSLKLREGQADLKNQVKKEVKEYEIDKKLNPIERPWLDRYRTAIEL